MTATEKQLHDALMVLLHSWPIVEHLQANDPMALAQARAAVEAAQNNSTQEA
jgi:hypothetical protein